MDNRQLHNPHPRRDRLLFRLLRFPGLSLRRNRVLHSVVPPTDLSRPVTDQRECRPLRYGLAAIEKVGCEVLAVYNLLLLLGRPTELCQLISHFEAEDTAMLWGFFGADPFRLGPAADSLGLPLLAICSPERLISACLPGQYALVSVWNRAGRPHRGVHTFLVQRLPDGSWQSWNRWYAPAPLQHSSLPQLLGSGRFITAWLPENNS